MPKKTTYSHNGAQAQRNRAKQKGFELVSPASDDNVLETVGTDLANVKASQIVDDGTEDDTEELEKEEEVVVSKKATPVTKAQPTGKSAVAATLTTNTDSKSKSAAVRMAERRQASQKAQRAPASMIVAENYAYVRKDLIFVLILALIMFSAIVIMHFIPAIGG